MFLLFRGTSENRKGADAGIYIPICFYYFLHKHPKPFVYFHLHSNMFLLFHFHVCGNFRSAFIYIPICFYYFLLLYTPNDFSFLSFTFQYVSIISTGSLFTSLTRIKFTFQYVSIISKIGSFVDGMVKDIYIPICFYYFVIRSNDVRLCNQFTFQYVSIISKNIKSYKI